MLEIVVKEVFLSAYKLNKETDVFSLFSDALQGIRSHHGLMVH